MNIKVHTSLVLATCTLTGVAFGGYLMHRGNRIDEDLRLVGPTSVTMRNVDLLADALGQWLICNDLVLHKGESFMVTSSMQQATRLRRLIGEIAATPLVGDQGGALELLRTDVDAVQQALLDARDLRGDDRAHRLAAIAEIADVRSEALVDRLATIELTLQRRATYLAQDLADQKYTLTLLTWLSACLYLVVIWSCWLWIVHRVVRPIEHLSNAADRAAADESEFRLNEDGPDEVRRMTHNIGRFVARLQHAKAHTEVEVRQRTAELTQANQAKGQFLATMSHELRTPLNGIINMNELMLDTPLDEEQQGFARTAKNAAEALLALINDILDFSKIEARKVELESADFAPRETVDGALEILAGLAESKGLELQAVVAPDVPSLLRGDAMRLRQIVVNLLNNALKFTAQGSVGVHVCVATAEAAHDVLRFEVRDTGIGIPATRVGALFQAFEQVDATTTRKYGGTGLGLAICKELSALMGGAIGVESEVGVGSTFWFTARFERVAAAAPVPPDLADRQIVLVSRRELLRARFTAQLRHLGVPAAAIATVGDVSELPPDAGAGRFLLLDPRSDPTAIAATVAAARHAAGATAAHTALLDHWLRRTPAELGPACGPVLRLVEPTRLEQLLAWLRGELTAGTPKQAPAPDLPATGAPGPSAAAPAPRAGAGRILVVEDNVVNQRVLTAVLRRAGHDLVLAEDGQQAMRAFRQGTFDLVVMDCEMPGMDGLEATRRIRALEVERAASSLLPSHVPIVALTADTREELAQQCMDAGMDRFLTKPFRPRLLLRTISELLSEPAGKAEIGAGSGPRILVADDNEVNRRVAQSVLSRAGYEVVLVDDGQLAVDFVTKSPVALILMDCQMPGMDGLAASTRIRELEAGGNLAAGNPTRVPIVALTGHTQASDRDDALAAGMDRFVTKPFRASELLSVVAELAGPARRRNRPEGPQPPATPALAIANQDTRPGSR